MGIIVALGVILILAVIIGLRSASIGKKFKQSDVLRADRMANFYGSASRGYGQVRGNGWLVLKGDALIFEMYVPVRTLVIPLETITAVEETRTHLGKLGKAGTSLLRITYRHGDREDTAAWSVNDVGAWIGELGRLRA